MNNKNCVIGLDLGTTAVKAAVYEIDGHCIAEVQQEEQLFTPRPGWVEQDPAAWYEHLCVLIREVAGTSKNGRILGIGVSSQGISFVPVDSSFVPLDRALCWLDGRASEETLWLKENMGEEKIFRITGKHLSSFYSLPKILWMKKNRADVYNRTHKILCTMDYAVARFTGRAITEPTMAAGTMMYDIPNNSWSNEILHKCNIAESILPIVTETEKEAGILGIEAANAAGLEAGIPVFGAGQDQKTSAYGVSITKGVATVSLGTAAAFEILVDRSINMDGLELPFCPYIENNKLVLEGCVSTAGAAIKWLNNLLRTNGYAEMDRLCAGSPPGSRGVRFFPLLEEGGSCRGITLGTGPEDMIRALYEGIVFEIKYQLELAVKAGAVINQLNVFGGAAKSRILCGILSDVSGYPVQTFRNRELCLFGAARLTAAALGADPEIFVRNGLAKDSYYEPDKQNEKQYEEIYFNYMQLRRK